MNTKRFFPVIHCVYPFHKQGVRHALQNTEIAIQNGADGVFLIGHELKYGGLCGIYRHVRMQYPDIWIGINFLDVSGYWSLLERIVKQLPGINGVWIDMLPDRRLDIPSSIEVFGGVAFKYRDPDIRGRLLKESCARAKQIVDVVTTSGTKTGTAPDVGKLEEIRIYISGTTHNLLFRVV